MEKFGFGKSNSSSTNSGFGGGLVNKLPFNHNKPPQTTNGPLKQVITGNCPNNQYALANVVAVNSQDFPDNVPILINDFFVFTTKHSNEMDLGVIGLNGSQRLWAGLSLNEPIQARTYDIFSSTGHQSYIGSLNIEITFRNRNKAVSTPFDQDELSKAFIKNFESQIFSPTQRLFLEFKGLVFDLTVQSIQAIDLADFEANGPASTDIQTKGLLVNQTNINFFKGKDGLVNIKASATRPRADAVIRPDFKFEDMGVGGLDKEFTKIFRRAFASRIFPPALVDKLGIRNVKGMLLYGPPGTGKTLIARKIGQMLNTREPKIVNGPEILSKYVGSSEENIRNLFKDAEAEYKAKGDESSLHIIIFDELDSMFKQRGSRGDGTGVGDNVVNQLLAKMDGVDQLNNILIIGMTNRRDLIDSALLRPGRFEVQVEINLPDEAGRFQILEIQTRKMKSNGSLDKDVSLKELAALSKNFSGAEIEGLVKSAASFALNKRINIGTGSTKINLKDLDKLKVTRSDFLNALEEVTPAFGVSEEDLRSCIDRGILKYSKNIDQILETGDSYVAQVRDDSESNLFSILFHGPTGSGKTALAASIALKSEFPFIRLVSASAMLGMSETAKIAYISDVFRDSSKSPLNIVILDSIESLIEWVPIGPRFSNNILQAIHAALKTRPPKNRRLLVIGTTSKYSVLQQMDVLDSFDFKVGVPNLKTLDELNNVMIDSNFGDDVSRASVLNQLAQLGHNQLDIGVKQALVNISFAKRTKEPVDKLVELLLSS